MAVEDAVGFRTSFVYDRAGRLEAVENARNYRTTNVYLPTGQVEVRAKDLEEPVAVTTPDVSSITNSR